MAEPSIDLRVNVLIIAVSKPCWMDSIIDFWLRIEYRSMEKK